MTHCWGSVQLARCGPWNLNVSNLIANWVELWCGRLWRMAVAVAKREVIIGYGLPALQEVTEDDVIVMNCGRQQKWHQKKVLQESIWLCWNYIGRLSGVALISFRDLSACDERVHAISTTALPSLPFHITVPVGDIREHTRSAPHSLAELANLQ